MSEPSPSHVSEPYAPVWVIYLMAASCGLIVANLYYAQPLISLIGASIGLNASQASLIVTVTQIGYCLGLIFLVPLGDLIENRTLIASLLSALVIALAVTAQTTQTSIFLSASLFIGLSAVSVQVLVPMAASITPEASRGRVVGNVVGGLLLGIMLARPVASFVSDIFGWRAIYIGSCGMMALLALILRGFLPRRAPRFDQGYVKLIASLGILVRDNLVLRRRSFYQAMLFGSFSLYWTAVPLALASAPFGYSQKGIALFALAGAAGALGAPIAGRWADKGYTRKATVFALALAAAAFVVARIGGAHGSIGLMLASAVLLDFGVQVNLVLGQRAIYSLGDHVRSRVNGIYLAMFFAGGAFGSFLASPAYAAGGWQLVSWIGLAFPLAALAFYAVELTSAKT